MSYNYNASYQEKVLITNDKTITADSKGNYAVDAYQLNPTEKGTLAYDLARKLDALDSAAAHNGIFRGKDITDLYQSGQLWTDIADGSFRNEYIGDYFDINISTEYTANEAVRCILGMFDPYLHKGTTPLERHHALIVPKNCFAKKHPMNPTDTTADGYAGSYMYNTVLPVYQVALQKVFGEHLLQRKALLTTGINADIISNAGNGLKGASSNWGWKDVYLSLMSEVQTSGCTICSSSFCDTGNDNFYLSLFALNQALKICGRNTAMNGNGDGTREWYWIKDVSSNTQFGVVVGDGGNSFVQKASTELGVRPFWLIG